MKKKKKVHFCHKHPKTKLQCPRCIAARGGRARARNLTASQLTEISQLGVTARKKKAHSTRFTLAE
jgi:hypothetical protein